MLLSVGAFLFRLHHRSSPAGLRQTQRLVVHCRRVDNRRVEVYQEIRLLTGRGHYADQLHAEPLSLLGWPKFT